MGSLGLTGEEIESTSAGISESTALRTMSAAIDRIHPSGYSRHSFHRMQIAIRQAPDAILAISDETPVPAKTRLAQPKFRERRAGCARSMNIRPDRGEVARRDLQPGERPYWCRCTASRTRCTATKATVADRGAPIHGGEGDTRLRSLPPAAAGGTPRSSFVGDNQPICDGRDRLYRDAPRVGARPAALMSKSRSGRIC